LLAALCAVALTVAACSSSSTSKGAGGGGSSSSASAAAGASTSASSGPLSQASVKSIVASGDPMIELASLSQGYFKTAGLDVTPTRTTSGSSDVALLVGGSVQFLLGGSAAVIAKQQGAPIKIIMAVNKGSDETLVISSKAAAEHNIPTTPATTPDAALAQLKALKGSHLTIGVTNTTGDGYNYLVADLAANGITIGPGKDVNIMATGGAPQLVAAYKTGKLTAFSITPPYTSQPNSVQVPLNLIAPDSDSAFFDLLTTEKMISDHPDTVQAFVDSMVQGWNYVKSQPGPADKALAPLYDQYIGSNSDEQIQGIFDQLSKDWGSVQMTQDEFNSTLKVVELAQPKQKLTVTYDDVVDNTFVTKALAKYPSAASASSAASS
jgi:NitT/TauT family transport system substrate-binding protein